jgi:exopolyphosphatase/guanosine-5'-triphosphate,3'-diphosphate pyrophosphatase
MRDAANRDAVQAAVRDATGLEVEVIAGATEAVWSYAAARSAFPALTGRAAVLDIGGGSTEVIVGDGLPAGAPPAAHAGAVAFRHSFDLGCIRLTERCFTSQPPAPGEGAAAARLIADAFASDAFAAERLPLGPDVPLIGTAGTLTALALADAGPDAAWDALDADARTLDAATVHRWRTRLLAMTEAEVRALHPAAMAGRADVFPVGVLLTDVLMQRHGLPRVHVSARDLRWGLALRALGR